MTTTSKEYAEALFELAAGEHVLEETSDGLVTVISALKQTPEYRSLLGSAALLLCAWQWTRRLGILGTAWAYMAGHGLTLFCELVFLAGREKRKANA